MLSLERSPFLTFERHDAGSPRHRGAARGHGFIMETSMDAPRRCPRCSSEEVIQIHYGTPGPDLLEEARAGRVALGGDVFWPEAPEWLCVACGHEWREGEEESGPLS
jgi:hypothetical protein